MKRRLSGLVLWVVVVLAGCGFHLRGQQTLSFSSLYMDMPANNALATLLRRSLSAHRVRLVDRADAAEVVLTPVAEQRSKVILSIDNNGLAREFELRLQYSFRVSDHKGNAVMPRQNMLLKRDFSYSDTAVFAKAEEEALLWRDMELDLVEQIVRRLASQRLEVGTQPPREPG